MGMTSIGPIVTFIPGVSGLGFIGFGEVNDPWFTGFYIFAEILFWGILTTGWWPWLMYMVDYFENTSSYVTSLVMATIQLVLWTATVVLMFASKDGIEIWYTSLDYWVDYESVRSGPREGSARARSEEEFPDDGLDIISIEDDNVEVMDTISVEADGNVEIGDMIDIEDNGDIEISF
jgi:hypothetical protein